MVLNATFLDWGLFSTYHSFCHYRVPSGPQRHLPGLGSIFHISLILSLQSSQWSSMPPFWTGVYFPHITHFVPTEFPVVLNATFLDWGLYSTYPSFCHYRVPSGPQCHLSGLGSIFHISLILSLQSSKWSSMPPSWTGVYFPHIPHFIPTEFPVVLNATFLDWGRFVDYYLTEAECLQVCAADDSCLGADYYSLHGGACWVHNISTVCLPTVDSPFFNHYQKLPCVPTLGATGKQR